MQTKKKLLGMGQLMRDMFLYGQGLTGLHIRQIQHRSPQIGPTSTLPIPPGNSQVYMSSTVSFVDVRSNFYLSFEAKSPALQR